MIVYDPFWRTMKAKNISSYKLEKQYGLSKSVIHKLRHNLNMELASINALCKMFECDIFDIIAYIPDEEDSNEKK